MEILRRVKSSYYSSFKEVCLKVNEGRSAPFLIYQCYLISFLIRVSHCSISHLVLPHKLDLHSEFTDIIIISPAQFHYTLFVCLFVCSFYFLFLLVPNLFLFILKIPPGSRRNVQAE